MSLDLKSNFLQNNFKDVKPPDCVVYEFGDFRLDTAHLMLYRQSGEEIQLTPKQVETLLALVKRRGEIVSKEELMNALWGDAVVEESNLSQNIYILRKVLGETADGKPMIETLRRRGYRFNGELKEVKQSQTETVSEHSTNQAITLLKFPEIVADQAIDEKSKAVDTSSNKRKIAVFSVVLLLIGALAFSYYFFTAKNAAVSDKKSIAVLPLKPINTTNRDEVYEIGIAESLIHRFGSTKGLFVRPLSATRKYTDLNQDLLAVGREQKVDYVLASNYQLANGRIRVTAQLFNVKTEQVEETYKIEKEVGDVFAMQDAIAGEMGNKLLTRLAIASSSGPAARLGTTNEEAYRLYLHGKNLSERQNPANLRKAVEHFEQAIRLDPNFARGYSRMAHVHIVSSFGVGDSLPRIEKEKTKEAVNKALELDNNLAEAYAVRGQLKMVFDWDLAGAEKDLQRAIELESNNDFAHYVYALSLVYRGRFNEALAEIDTALMINPGSPAYQRDRGRFLYYARRYDEAIVQFKRAIELDENSEMAWGFLWTAYEKKGDEPQAYETFQKWQMRWHPDRVEVYQKAYETAGWHGVRRQFLEFSKLGVQKSGSNFFTIARHCALLGEKEEAFEYLNKAFEKHQSQMIMLKVDPGFDSLRDDPRFDELIRRVGLK